MRLTWGVIVGLAIQGGLSQSGAPAEGELTVRQETTVPDTELPVTEVEQPVVSEVPPAQTGPAETNPVVDGPSPTDASPPQVTESEQQPGSNTEPVGDVSSVAVPPPPPQDTGVVTTPGFAAPTDEPAGSSAQAADTTAVAEDRTELDSNTPAATGAASQPPQAPGQTATKGEDSTIPVNNTPVPTAISSAIESAITSAIRSAEEASTVAGVVSTVVGGATTVAGESRTVTNRPPVSDGSSGTTLTTRVAASTTSTVTASVSLQSASVGDNAEIKTVDGKPAVVLSPPAGGQASFDVSVAKPVEVKKKDLIQVKANVSVSEMTQDNSSQQGSDNEDDGCDLKMDVNGKNVYSDKLSATTKERFEITSDFFEAGDKQDIKFSQKCGKTPRSLTVDGMALQGQVMVANSNGGGSGSGSGSGSGGSGGSETTSSDGSKNTDKGNFASSNKPAAFFMGLFAALVVLVI